MSRPTSEFLQSWQDKTNRIVVFAGVFDPVHKGHVSAAESALFYGNTVVFLPERVPQHKHGATPYTHRLNMLRIATQYNSQFTVLDYPYDNQWIAQTFSWLQESYPNRKFVWLVGSDVAPLISIWQDADKLSEFGVEQIVQMKREGNDEVYVNAVYKTPVTHVVRPRKKHENLSSSWIREDVVHRHTALPDGVWEYIRQNNLYA